MTDMHREAFEQMSRDHDWHVQRIEPQVLGGSQYSEIYVSCAWVGWQAAMRYRDEQEKQA